MVNKVICFYISIYNKLSQSDGTTQLSLKMKSSTTPHGIVSLPVVGDNFQSIIHRKPDLNAGQVLKIELRSPSSCSTGCHPGVCMCVCARARKRDSAAQTIQIATVLICSNPRATCSTSVPEIKNSRVLCDESIAQF